MRRIVLLFAWLLLTQFAGATTDHSDLLVHFEKDRSTLTAETIAALDAFIAGIDLSGDYALDVHGHTDSDGSQAYNLALSQARAEAVRDYLVEHGVDPELIVMERSGERDPLATNNDVEGMAENRRVRIDAVQYQFADLNELRAELAAGSVQHFMVDPVKDQVLEGTNGARVLLLANTLVDAAGRPVTGPVDVAMTEALGIEAMIAHQLSTKCGDRLLETAGMVKVEAVDANGARLQLRAGSTMQVAVPKGADQPGMQLFTSNNGANWNATGSMPIARAKATATVWTEMPFQQPTLPQAGYPAFIRPVYKEDRTGKPRRPLDPWLPNEPVRPRAESYAAHVAWWQMPWQGRLEARAQERYQRALLAFEERMEKYQQQVTKYDADCAAMPERLAQYALDKAAWDAKKEQEHDAWWANEFEPARTRHDSIYAEPIAAYYAATQAYWQEYTSLYTCWREERTECLAEYAALAERNGTADLGGLNAYVFNASQLGWINCDRFYDVPAYEKYSASAVDKDRTDEQVFLVFTDIHSLVAMQPNVEGIYSYPGVPRSQPAQVVAFKVKDGRPMLCVRAVKPGQAPALEYERSSFMAIKRMLQGLAGTPS